MAEFEGKVKIEIRGVKPADHKGEQITRMQMQLPHLIASCCPPALVTKQRLQRAEAVTNSHPYTRPEMTNLTHHAAIYEPTGGGSAT